MVPYLSRIEGPPPKGGADNTPKTLKVKHSLRFSDFRRLFLFAKIAQNGQNLPDEGVKMRVK